jgi:hypothetical protein
MKASIAKAVAKEDYILHVILDNGNELTLDIKPLLEYPLFGQLSEVKLWKTMQVHNHYLSWRDGDVEVELSVDEILDYIA